MDLFSIRVWNDDFDLIGMRTAIAGGFFKSQSRYFSSRFISIHKINKNNRLVHLCDIFLLRPSGLALKPTSFSPPSSISIRAGKVQALFDSIALVRHTVHMRLRFFEKKWM